MRAGNFPQWQGLQGGRQQEERAGRAGSEVSGRARGPDGDVDLPLPGQPAPNGSTRGGMARPCREQRCVHQLVRRWTTLASGLTNGGRVGAASGGCSSSFTRLVKLPSLTGRVGNMPLGICFFLPLSAFFLTSRRAGKRSFGIPFVALAPPVWRETFPSSEGSSVYLERDSLGDKRKSVA
jgi:hypothetical protein